jgi:dihydrofolate reductase
MVSNKSGLRKLKLQVQMSIDGCIAGPNGEMDWMVGLEDDKINKYVNELTESFGTILLGRKMADGFISYWPDVINKPNDPWYALGKKMIEIPKVVFTNTLKKSKWINTDIATGDTTDEIMKLKREEGKDMVVYGGASFDSSLIKLGLIDEFLLFINPVAIGNGLTIFKDLNEIQEYSLVKSIAFDSGEILLHYETRKA